MLNYGIRIDLLKIKGASIKAIQGKTSVKKCIIIPVEDNDGLYLGEKGCYLNLTAIEMQEAKYGDTHCVKPNLSKEQREALTDEQKKAIPILGGLRTIERKTSSKFENARTIQANEFAPADGYDDDDLPF